ncbi:site-specific integrase [Burkholderia pseudomallei]|uniref:site-specific integrase n=1 Tax=Burkholderia pseudomallei TaxID=28450 RepID=UPI000A1A247D|nr:site-specific integrase [Burkholderia pseudomallei]ARL87139.1 integrase [Burkholderia pseudomallei]
MSNTAELRSSTALANTLPERVFTRSGSSFDPREDVWEWADGPFNARIDFRRYTGDFKTFVLWLKHALLPFVKGHSYAHVTNLNQAFSHFANAMQTCGEGAIGAQHISNYAAKLGVHEIGRLGTLNGLLQKWVDLGLPGVEPECATYLLERRKPGNKKGEAVRTRNPVEGPLSEEEYAALYSAVNAAYGRGTLPLWMLLLTRLLLACGGRISQYAALKLVDFDDATLVLNLPQAKTGLKDIRSSFLRFDISPQTARLITEYKSGLRAEGYDENSAFFPQALVMPKGPRKQLRDIEDPFYGHCIPHTLGTWFRTLMVEIAPPTSRLDFAPMPLTPKRFRYTFGTRLAEEGASKVVIANRMGHADLQQVDVYVAASPKIVENIDKTMGTLLAPLARAFKGQVVEDEQHATHKGAPGSRIIDFRVSNDPVGSCAGKGRNCAFNKPVACYACFRFEPWLDAPHEKVLARLESERENWSSDDRMAAVNDEPIRAVKEVIALCAQIWQQRAEQESETES